MSRFRFVPLVLSTVMAPLPVIAQERGAPLRLTAIMPGARMPDRATAPLPGLGEIMVTELRYGTRLTAVAATGLVLGFENEAIARQRLTAGPRPAPAGPAGQRGPGVVRVLAGGDVLPLVGIAAPGVRLETLTGLAVAESRPVTARDARHAAGLAFGLDLTLPGLLPRYGTRAGPVLAAFARADWLPTGTGGRASEGRIGPGWISSAGLRLVVALR